MNTIFMKKTVAYTKPSEAVLLIIFVVLSALTIGIFLLMRPTQSFSPSNFAATVVAPLDVSSVVPETPHFHYIEIIDGCGPYFDVTPCVNLRSGAGEEYPIVARLRTGVVLKVESETVQQNGYEWYKIIFDGEIRYPERVAGDWYVVVDPVSVLPLENIGDEEFVKGVTASTTKRIVVDLSEEKIYAYDGYTLFMEEFISTGLDDTPTPVGTFTIYRKTPSRYMQGPIVGVSDQFYDLPGVPWNLYFTKDGAVIHGAYWHDHFGRSWSHGCVNLPPQKAKELYKWAAIGTPVTVRN